MNKEIKQILISYAFFALSCGMFYNFQELWMASNSLSVKTIGTVYSICALLSVSTIFLCSNLLKQNKLKKFTSFLMLLKACVSLLLFFLNNTNHLVIIKFLVMVDYVLKVEIAACVYPIMSIIDKNDKLYAAKSLIYSWVYYIGILLTSLLLGKTIGIITISYNSYCLIGSLLMFISFFILKNVKLNKYKMDDKVNQNIVGNLVDKVKKDKISLNYFGYLFTNQIAYSCVTKLILTIFVTKLNFSDVVASNTNLILCIVSAFLGTLILSKFTLKNNYINFSIKYIGRCVFYFLAFLTNSNLFFLLAIVYSLVLSDSYIHVTDAPYINRFSNKEQLAFCNLKEMVSYVAVSIGTLICALTLQFGFKYNFLVETIFIIIATLFGFNAIRLHNIEKENGK